MVSFLETTIEDLGGNALTLAISTLSAVKKRKKKYDNIDNL